ncbi:hypothetical protein [Hahella ganghwensis]|uniref:hypothetical protein n=1 Tax=Hahella ganghwensis TaxID=286420 RepID=UPI00035DFE7C|nr:hypothetical protein [Hahella ganghwensis]
MKKFVLMIAVALLASMTVLVKAQEPYADVDREMIELLALNSDQASAYIEIMQKQREAFLALKTREWQQELALYRETYAMLEPVLTRKQHAQFVAIINSVVESTTEEEFVAMRD